MKSRAALIRYRSWIVDERRKVLGDLYSQMTALDVEDDQIVISMSVEQVNANTVEVGTYAYPQFLNAAMGKREQIANAKEALEEEISVAKEELVEAYQELKKIEVLEERRLAREKVEQNRREQGELDEIATDRYRRLDKDSERN